MLYFKAVGVESPVSDRQCYMEPRPAHCGTILILLIWTESVVKFTCQIPVVGRINVDVRIYNE